VEEFERCAAKRYRVWNKLPDAVVEFGDFEVEVPVPRIVVAVGF
jgi:hypothetical protein